MKDIPSWQPANHTSRTFVSISFSKFWDLTGVSHLLIGIFIFKGCEGSHILVGFLIELEGFKLEESLPCELEGSFPCSIERLGL